MLWDLYCRVVDNYGDIGVGWRLAADLASRGERVRLWLDDARALDRMAPGGAEGVEVRPWPADAQAEASGEAVPEPSDVVIEAFGCELPARVIEAMAARNKPPVWINLEYLSAEPYVERSHGLRSPQLAGPGAGLVKWFFYPGFTASTGGLLREPDLIERRAAFDRMRWLGTRGWAPVADEQVVVLFSYNNPCLPALLESCALRPTLLLACPGPAQRQLGRLALPPTLRRIDLPWLTQREFDHLLWSADLNLVRGEDSLVRAIWAGQPFVWQAYPQHDMAHAAKLEAFLDLVDRVAAPTADASWRGLWRGLWRAWNGPAPWPAQLPAPAAWREACLRWRDALLAQPDLGTQLQRFVAKKR